MQEPQEAEPLMCSTASKHDTRHQEQLQDWPTPQRWPCLRVAGRAGIAARVPTPRGRPAARAGLAADALPPGGRWVWNSWVGGGGRRVVARVQGVWAQARMSQLPACSHARTHARMYGNTHDARTHQLVQAPHTCCAVDAAPCPACSCRPRARTQSLLPTAAPAPAGPPRARSQPPAPATCAGVKFGLHASAYAQLQCSLSLGAKASACHACMPHARACVLWTVACVRPRCPCMLRLAPAQAGLS